MKYCSECSAELKFGKVDGDNKQRHFCSECGMIFYVNPKIVTLSIPVWEDQVLIAKRDIEPGKGLWTLPGGFMEADETVEQAVVRETKEEVCADVHELNMFAVVNVPQIHQVHLFYKANLTKLEYSAGHETQDVKLISKKNYRPDEFSFESVRRVLNAFFDDPDLNETLHETVILNK